MLYFDEHLAKGYGLEKSIIWCYVVNNLADRPFKVAHLTGIFPFWSKCKLARLLKEMADEHILDYSNYREYKGQAINWYEVNLEDEE